MALGGAAGGSAGPGSSGPGSADRLPAARGGGTSVPDDVMRLDVEREILTRVRRSGGSRTSVDCGPGSRCSAASRSFNCVREPGREASAPNVPLHVEAVDLDPLRQAERRYLGYGIEWGGRLAATCSILATCVHAMRRLENQCNADVGRRFRAVNNRNTRSTTEIGGPWRQVCDIHSSAGTPAMLTRA